MIARFIFIVCFIFMGIQAGAQYTFPIKQDSKSPQQFQQILTLAYKKYAKVYEAYGLKLVVEADWSSHVDNAMAYTPSNGRARVFVHGGSYRHHDLTNDGMLMVLCHEFGHHLGGAPKKVNGASVEGQADYYAAHTCMPIMLATEDNEAWLRRNPVGLTITQNCNRIWGKFTPRSLICMRAMTAAVSMAYWANSSKQLPDPSKKDPTQSGYTMQSHPQAQCRLDTMMAASICTSENDKGMNRGAVCSFYQAVERRAIRPACWYYDPMVHH